MKKERIYTYLISAGAIASFIAGSYIVIDMSIKAGNLDFSWASNILIGIAGILVLAGGYYHNIAKKKEADLFSD